MFNRQFEMEAAETLRAFYAIDVVHVDALADAEALEGEFARQDAAGHDELFHIVLAIQRGDENWRESGEGEGQTERH